MKVGRRGIEGKEERQENECAAAFAAQQMSGRDVRG